MPYQNMSMESEDKNPLRSVSRRSAQHIRVMSQEELAKPSISMANNSEMILPL